MPSSVGKHGPLMASIDQGTSSGRFMVFSIKTMLIVAKYQIPISLTNPKEGWVEQDPNAIINVMKECIANGVEELKKQGCFVSDIVAVGITNQRESVVAWDKQTGKALYNAIIWQDMRTANTLNESIDTLPGKDKNYFQSITGLPLSPYFSASKIRWLLENVDEVRTSFEQGSLLVGTVDSWMIWNLTGGPNGGLHATDVSNASRTLLMNLHTLKWDPALLKFFRVPSSILPEIRSSSEIYAPIAEGHLQGIPIAGIQRLAEPRANHATLPVQRSGPLSNEQRFRSGQPTGSGQQTGKRMPTGSTVCTQSNGQVLGDQQAALVGQNCFKTGQAKNTYGTGCFLLYNTGHKAVHSKCGLVTTVAYQMGPNQPATYALEGSVAVAGAAFNWLRDNVDLLTDVSHSEALAHTVSNTGDVYFVPAFSGLYAPHWQADARGVICGISETTSRSHIIRAALEAVCFQTRDILDAMNKDSGFPLTELRVDGGMTANTLLMQLQSDLIGISVVRPKMAETTALGAALAAAAALGALDISKELVSEHITLTPQITEEERNERYTRWKMAVERSFGWEANPL